VKYECVRLSMGQTAYFSETKRFFRKEGMNMARVAREMVEKAGVNVDQLLKLLVSNAAAELTTFYYYCGFVQARRLG
jgi:hypothetical protein